MLAFQLFLWKTGHARARSLCFSNPFCSFHLAYRSRFPSKSLLSCSLVSVSLPPAGSAPCLVAHPSLHRRPLCARVCACVFVIVTTAAFFCLAVGWPVSVCILVNMFYCVVLRAQGNVRTRHPWLTQIIKTFMTAEHESTCRALLHVTCPARVPCP